MESEKNLPGHSTDLSSENIDYKNMVFASIDSEEILGSDILKVRNRILIENEESESFVFKETSENNHYINIEALQKLLEVRALIKMAIEEGCTVSDDEVSKAIFEARSEFGNDLEWDTSLLELSLGPQDLREHFFYDLSISNLLTNHYNKVPEVDAETVKLFYDDNIESMKINSIYTFIEIEVPCQDQVKNVVEILSESDLAKISQKSQELSIPFKVNEKIAETSLPDILKEVCRDLKIGKIGTIPLEGGSVLLVKVLQKIPEKHLSLEEASPGLKEYIRTSKHKEVLDSLVESALQKCAISYSNLPLLKNLSFS